MYIYILKFKLNWGREAGVAIQLTRKLIWINVLVNLDFAYISWILHKRLNNIQMLRKLQNSWTGSVFFRQNIFQSMKCWRSLGTLSDRQHDKLICFQNWNNVIWLPNSSNQFSGFLHDTTRHALLESLKEDL